MRGRLKLTTVDVATGHVSARRRAANTVLQSGAEMIAGLFSGTGTGITHMGVGVSDADPESTEVAGLEPGPTDGIPGLEGATAAPIAPEAFAIEPDPGRRLVRVRVRATLPADAAVGVVREAGLLARGEAGDVLYNRVTFAPVDKGDDHELTMFWEVEFPFGDLQWLP